MANRLAQATSPYLLQHKDNPVDWWEWSDEAFEVARQRNLPILLSVGYAACHWCAVIDRVLRIWRQNIKTQVRATISVRSGSATNAV